MRLALLVMAAGALGTGLRYGLNAVALRGGSPALPWHTFAVNVVGAFAIGLAFALGADQLSERARIVVGAGLLGGMTTFSGVMLESLRMLEDGRTLAATSYLAASVGIGMLAVFAGALAGRALA